MKEYRDDKLAFYWHEGILVCDWLVEEADYDLVELGINIRKEMTGKKNVIMLSDVRNLKFITRAGRERLAGKDGGEGVMAVAIVMNSKIQAIMFNFFNSIYKSPSPTKLFNDRNEAIKWCKKFINENSGSK